MPQIVCYFQKKITETFSYHWKNCIVSAPTWTRPGADSNYYGPSEDRSSNISFPQCWNNLCWTCYRKFTGVCFNIGGMIRCYCCLHELQLLFQMVMSPWLLVFKTALNQIMLSLKIQVSTCYSCTYCLPMASMNFQLKQEHLMGCSVCLKIEFRMFLWSSLSKIVPSV